VAGNRRWDVITLGEAMIRLNPPGGQRLEQAAEYCVYVGGSEANVAVGLARLGLKTAWISRLPQNPLGRRIAAEIGAHGVDISEIVWTPTGRVGVFYLEVGGSPRGSRVIYDRQGSAASQMTVDDIDWNLLGQARHLHVSGITVALSASCRAVVERALAEAKKRGLTVSFDVNYRSRLWPPEEAREALEPMLGVDVAICTLADARTVFRQEGPPEEAAAALRKAWGADIVVITLGADGALAYTGRQTLRGRGYRVDALDRVGAGDAYDAGFLCGYLAGDLGKAMAYGGAMAAWKHTEPGDFCYASVTDLEALLAEEAQDIRR
jgi:2-dehydro-3-deoxygluconokinase